MPYPLRHMQPPNKIRNIKTPSLSPDAYALLHNPPPRIQHVCRVLIDVCAAYEKIPESLNATTPLQRGALPKTVVIEQHVGAHALLVSKSQPTIRTLSLQPEAEVPTHPLGNALRLNRQGRMIDDIYIYSSR